MKLPNLSSYPNFESSGLDIRKYVIEIMRKKLVQQVLAVGERGQRFCMVVDRPDTNESFIIFGDENGRPSICKGRIGQWSSAFRTEQSKSSKGAYVNKNLNFFMFYLM